VFQSSLRPSPPPYLGTVRPASCESLYPVPELHRPRLSQVCCTRRRNTTLMHFTCYYFKHRCQPSSTVVPQCQLLASLPPFLRDASLTTTSARPQRTDRQTDRQTDTTSDQQRLGTPPSRRPGVGGSLTPPLELLFIFCKSGDKRCLEICFMERWDDIHEPGGGLIEGE